MDDFGGKVAVVTGGASGIGKALVRALLREGARVVIGDVEAKALDAAVSELRDELRGELKGQGGELRGVVVDVSKPESLESLAADVYATEGACHLLFNNAGVAAPNANVWETTINDWRWVHGVNVHGVMHGILAFVPRMIESGEEGYVINTSSGDGGISPLPYQSVYASSKAAVSCLTECLAAQLEAEGTKLRASIFYPSGGLLETGIWSTARNRPAELARERESAPVPTIDEFKQAAKAAGMDLQFQDLDELAQVALQGIRDEKFVIMIGHGDAHATLADRADRIGKGDLPIDPAGIPAM